MNQQTGYTAAAAAASSIVSPIHWALYWPPLVRSSLRQIGSEHEGCCSKCSPAAKKLCIKAVTRPRDRMATRLESSFQLRVKQVGDQDFW